MNKILLLFCFICVLIGFINAIQNEFYVFKPVHMCARNEVCLNKLPTNKQIRREYLSSRKKTCKCKGIYKYACSWDYCAISTQTCKSMFERKLENTIIYQINGCI